MTKSIEDIYKDYDKAKEDCRIYAEEDELLQKQVDELIRTNALPPNYGMDTPDFRNRLDALRIQSSENFNLYMKARKAYEKAADELIEYVSTN